MKCNVRSYFDLSQSEFNLFHSTAAVTGAVYNNVKLRVQLVLHEYTYISID